MKGLNMSMERTVTRAEFIAHVRQMLDGQTDEPCVAIFENTPVMDRRTGADRGPGSFSLFRDTTPNPFTPAEREAMHATTLTRMSPELRAWAAESGDANRYAPTMNNTLNGERGSFLKAHRTAQGFENDVDAFLIPLLAELEAEGPITYIIGRYVDPKGVSYYVESETP
jgi:hypothetical protein